MQILKNRSITIIMTLVLLSSMAISIVAIPNASAAGTKKTFPFVGATPNPIGVGQQTIIRFGITDQLATASYAWSGLTVTVTHPDGTKETLGPFSTDSTGGTYTLFTPAVVGNYTLQSHFPQQINQATTTSANTFNGIPANTTMLASDSAIVTLVVQQEPVPSYPTSPLPTDYWTRPINDQLQVWASIGGNWLTATNTAMTNNRIAVGNDYAPQSAHILWSKPLTSGGLVGGSTTFSQDITNARLEIGDAYEGKFLGSVILLGKLYFDEYSSVDQMHQITCVDLHTGEQLWSRVLLNNLTLSRGELFNWNSIDLLGTYDYLWATANSATLPLLGLPSNAGTTWCAFDPFNGDYVYSIYGVPSGTVVYGPNGELMVYTVDLTHGFMTLWNSTNIPKLWSSTEINSQGWGMWQPEGKIVNATGPTGETLNLLPSQSGITPLNLNGYMYNVTIPTGLPGSVQSILDDRIVGLYSSSTKVVMWALSLKAGQQGQLLYNTTWAPPADWAAGNVTIAWQATSDQSKNGVLILGEKETQQNYGFSVETGQYLWVTQPRKNYLDYATMGLVATSSRAINEIYNGRFYSGSYAGTLYCYDATTGNLLWTYTAENPYALGATWADWPLYPAFIAGGMIYFLHTEHSGYEQSLPPGAPFMCLNATTGELIWRADGLFRGTHWGGYPLIGDSIIAAMNTYDQQIYAIGRGPSSITVDAPTTGSVVGNSLVIRGMVTDVSPGTQQDALKLRFPNGVPAISDDNMSDWMGYIYEQIPLSSNVQGVPVIISVIDANGNYRQIGTATSDMSGSYSLAWKPDVPGKYTVIATFEGTNSYYGSKAETAFAADQAPSATTAPTATPLSMVDTYFLPSVAAIIIVIIIVGLALAILMLRKRP